LKTHLLGKTGLEITELGFGGAAIGNLYRATSNIEAYASIAAAWEAGFRYFDTAPSYGYGLSERRLGDALRPHDRSSYIVSTKVGKLLVPDATPKRNDLFPGSLPFSVKYDYSYDGIMRSFEDSLQRLGLNAIDILYVHDLGHHTHGDEHELQLKTFLQSGYRALDELRSQKVVRAIGVGANEWEVCMQLLPKTNLDCVMLAGRYTLLEQGALQEFFPECERRNVSIIVSGPYNSGVLAYGKNYNYTAADADVVAHVEKLKKICDEFQIYLPQAAIQFPLRHPQVISVVPGIRTQEQAAVAANYLQNPIPEAFWTELKTQELVL
jgi:D-threo-aldose 1-dehydrogenase